MIYSQSCKLFVELNKRCFVALFAAFVLLIVRFLGIERWPDFQRDGTSGGTSGTERYGTKREIGVRHFSSKWPDLRALPP